MTLEEKLEIVSKNYADKYVESINVKNMVHKAYCEGFKTGYEKAATNNSHPLCWIPASVQMPDFDQNVLVWLSYGSYEIGYLNKDPNTGELKWRLSLFDVYNMEGVEAWMPLPKPYIKGDYK